MFLYCCDICIGVDEFYFNGSVYIVIIKILSSLICLVFLYLSINGVEVSNF